MWKKGELESEAFIQKLKGKQGKKLFLSNVVDKSVGDLILKRSPYNVLINCHSLIVIDYFVSDSVLFFFLLTCIILVQATLNSKLINQLMLLN